MHITLGGILILAVAGAVTGISETATGLGGRGLRYGILVFALVSGIVVILSTL